MGNLRLSKALNMSKATVSFWFRIPKEVAQAVAKREDTLVHVDFAVLQTTVPLLMFGAQQSGPVYDLGGAIIGYLPYSDPVYAPDPVPIYGTVVTGSHTAPLMPSCIGVQFDHEKPDNDGWLLIHLQTSDFPTGQNLSFTDGGGVELFYDEHGDWNGGWRRLPLDVTYTRVANQDYFGNVDGGYRDPETGELVVIDIKTDKWHHILISWDLSRGSAAHGSDEPTTIAAGTDAFSLMWVALDDVEHKSKELPAIWMEGGNPNGHLSSSTVAASALDNRYGPASASLSVGQIPANPMTIPAPAKLERASGPMGETETIEAGQKVEMAELQIWCGQTLNAGLLTSRRAFIDFQRDKDGAIVVDKTGKSEMVPVDMDRAKQLMGRRPDIVLHGSGNWQNGENTGSTGLREDAGGGTTEIPSGQFKPTGTINKYEPDPSITTGGS